MHDATEHTTPQQENSFHTYETHSIPWYVRAIWLGFWIGAVWYIAVFAIPMAKVFFE